MTKWSVQPLQGFENVTFGMSRKEVRNILGNPTNEFRKSKYSKTLADDYLVYHTFYNSKDELEAVEIFEGIEVSINGVVVFPQPIEIIKSLGYDFTDEADGCISLSHSIGIYAPGGVEESILFGCRDYYK